MLATDMCLSSLRPPFVEYLWQHVLFFFCVIQVLLTCPKFVGVEDSSSGSSTYNKVIDGSLAGNLISLFESLEQFNQTRQLVAPSIQRLSFNLFFIWSKCEVLCTEFILTNSPVKSIGQQEILYEKRYVSSHCQGRNEVLPVTLLIHIDFSCPCMLVEGSPGAHY